jgi:hypothetical protein
MNDYFDAEGRLYTRDRHEPQAEAPHDEAHIEPPLDSTGLYTVAGADGKPRTRVHSDVLHSIVSGLAERVAVTDERHSTPKARHTPSRSRLALNSPASAFQTMRSDAISSQP